MGECSSVLPRRCLRCVWFVLMIGLYLTIPAAARETRDTDLLFGDVYPPPRTLNAREWPIEVGAAKAASPVGTAEQGAQDAAVLGDGSLATADGVSTARPSATPQSALPGGWSQWLEPAQFGSTVRFAIAMTVLSLAPAILLMTTSYVRIVVVLSILKQALGLQNAASNQIVTAATLFLTCLIMWPVWKEVHTQAIVPYTQGEPRMSLEQAWQTGVRPVHQFMSRQIDLANNGADVHLFLEYLNSQNPDQDAYAYVRDYDQVPLQALLPAFLLSELKTAFLIGFQLYLPFVVLDLVVASLTVAMGMFMVPPSTIATPLKLLLFVLVDGWHLVVEMLLASFGR